MRVRVGVAVSPLEVDKQRPAWFRTRLPLHTALLAQRLLSKERLIFPLCVFFPLRLLGCHCIFVMRLFFFLLDWLRRFHCKICQTENCPNSLASHLVLLSSF